MFFLYSLVACFGTFHSSRGADMLCRHPFRELRGRLSLYPPPPTQLHTWLPTSTREFREAWYEHHATLLGTFVHQYCLAPFIMVFWQLQETKFVTAESLKFNIWHLYGVRIIQISGASANSFKTNRPIVWRFGSLRCNHVSSQCLYIWRLCLI
jgi:hypothetical protein